MSSTSTNKQPLLVDRPLHEFAILGASACLGDAANFATLVSGGLFPLVDCSDGDGAVIDSLSLVANQANMSAVVVLFYLSDAATPFGASNINTALVASAALGSSAAGERTNVPLPPLCIPVPNLGGQTAVTEGDKKNTGLYVPAGRTLFAGLNEVILQPTPAATVNVFAQGGYF
jgi:hypothetical protein